jgi:DNA-binding MarR family transcriptional regulator
MVRKGKVETVKKISQQYAYSSLQLHETIARKAGFSGTDHKYLGFFLQKGSLTAGELATLAGLTTGSVTGLIDRFEKKKLVKRMPDKSDRRKVIVVPDNEKIMALMKPLYQNFQKQTEDLLGSFTDRELDVIENYLVSAIKLAKEETKVLEAKR